MQSLKSLETHFEFGANWLDYLNEVDEQAITQAEQGLRRLLPTETIQGSRFLDIGCGSGLHSLAAVRLGAADVTAIDIDPKSVEAARRLLEGRAPGAKRRVEVLSIFDAEPETLGTYDVVYSWGVLHHTGAMWEAVARAARFVKPDGLFTLALYQRVPTCGLWRREKRAYARAAPIVQKCIRGIYKGLYVVRIAAGGRNPVAYFRNYRSARGMSFHHDAHDWLGGYPYESATPEEVERFLQDRGFELLRAYPLPRGFGVLGTGCAEYTFRRRAEATDSRSL